MKKTICLLLAVLMLAALLAGCAGKQEKEEKNHHQHVSVGQVHVQGAVSLAGGTVSGH